MEMDKELKPWTSTIKEELGERSAVFYSDLDHIEVDENQRMHKNMGKFFDMRSLAKEFIQVQPLIYDQSKLWWMWDWNDRTWNITDEVNILTIIDKVGEQKIGTIAPQQKSMILESLKRQAREIKPKKFKKNWVQFKDCIIDLNDKELTRYIPTPHFFCVNTIPHYINMSQKTPVIDKIFEEWVGKDRVKTLWQIIAYCMLPDYPLHRIFCLNGSGLNGKSKYLELLTKIIGEKNVISTDLDLLLNNRFEVTKLHKKLVCLMGETNFNEMKKTALLKRLSGGDIVGFEYKNKNPFDDVNYAKIIIATNSLPITHDKTVGYYRRWMILDFPNQFSEKKDILAGIPKVEYECAVRKCIILLKELMKTREFHKEGSIEDRMKKYEDISNPLQKFIKEKCLLSSEGFVFKYSFYDTFYSWMSQQGYRIWSKKETGTFMKALFDEGKKYKDDGSDRYWAWLGISLDNKGSL